MHETNVLEVDNTDVSLVAHTDLNHEPTNSPKGKSRRMRLLERMGCFGSPPEGVQVYRATSYNDLHDAYRLVYESYIQKGYILPSHNKIRIRSYEASPDTATFVAKVKGKIVGVTTVIMDSKDLFLPSDEAFHEEIDTLRSAGRIVCEGANWVVSPEYRRTNVLNELMRCSFAHADVSGCHDWIVAVSPGHGALFFDILRFYTLGSERSYSEKIHDPVVLACLPLDGLEKRFADVDVNDADRDDEAWIKNHYIVNNLYKNRVREWEKYAHVAFYNPVFLRRLFVEKANLFLECLPEEQNAIRHRWGVDIFQNVWEYHLIWNELAIPISAESHSLRLTG